MTAWKQHGDGRWTRQGSRATALLEAQADGDWSVSLWTADGHAIGWFCRSLTAAKKRAMTLLERKPWSAKPAPTLREIDALRRRPAERPARKPRKPIAQRIEEAKAAGLMSFARRLEAQQANGDV